MKMKYASFGERASAYIIDNVLLSGVMMLFYIPVLILYEIFPILLIGLSEDFLIMVTMIIFDVFILYVYFTYMIGKYGYTVGKRHYGIKVVTLEGKIPGYKKAFLRAIGYVISSIFLYLGFIWIAIDKKKQGWHDKLAKTYVIREVRK